MKRARSCYNKSWAVLIVNKEVVREKTNLILTQFGTISSRGNSFFDVLKLSGRMENANHKVLQFIQFIDKYLLCSELYARC